MKLTALFACTRRQLLRTTALALALPLLPLATASAQVNCHGIGAQNCSLATDQYPYFQSFATLPLTTACGKALLAANLDAVNSIYLNATVSSSRTRRCRTPTPRNSMTAVQHLGDALQRGGERDRYRG